MSSSIAADPRKELGRARRRFHAWMFDAALPFWAGHGLDPAGHGAIEHLAINGGHEPVPFKRMRVQARQIYTYSHAVLLGWDGDGLGVARCCFEFIRRHGWREGGGWVRLLGPEGGVVDPAADLYDNAFVLFGLAWYARASQSAEALDWAWRTLRWIEAQMPHVAGGFEAVLPADGGHRQQNPHMHLLEAVLALHGTTFDQALADLAHELVRLFQRHFFDRTTGTLGEFFTEDWMPAPGEAGSRVEPGHHYEWVWLLDQYRGLTGGPLAPEARALYQFAERFGTHPTTGLVVNAVGRDGSLRDPASRLWPQTEAIKAHLAMAAHSVAEAPAKAAAVVDILLDRYFAPAPRGAWIDVFDASGRPCADRIPTSSLYHVFVAFAELEKAVSRTE